MQTIISLISLIFGIATIYFVFRIASLSYQRGWIRRQRQIFDLMSLMSSELEKIDPKNKESIKLINESWIKFLGSVANSKIPDWKEVFRKPQKKTR